MSKKKTALYDFDGTLVRGDSFITFARHSRGLLPLLGAILRTSPKLIKWKLGVISNSEAKQALFSNLYKGMPASELRDKAASFTEYLDLHIISDTFTDMERRKKEGWRIIVVTASADLWLRPWCDAHGVELVSTEVETDSDGKLTGRFSTPNCHGDEKRRRILSYLGIDKESLLTEYEFKAFGDSKSDDFMKSLEK